MKRLLSCFLAVCLALALAVPAAAATEDAGDMEKKLQDVTIRVKNVLEIDDEYAEFSGSYNDGLRPGWNLYWSDEGRDLSVQCDESGVITEVSRWENGRDWFRFSGFDPAFPDLSEDEARTAAEAWLARLMGKGETARIDRTDVTLKADGDYRFSGTILLNGLDSPITFRMTVGSAGLTGYSRSDGYVGYVGAVPPSVPAAKEPDAAKALKDAVVLDLYYVTDADGQARLRYVPVGPRTVVDAQTGEAVDMDALYAAFGSSYTRPQEAPAAAAMEMDSGAGRGLTEVELSSIANYADVIPQEKLDASMRAITEMGLAGFELARCSYVMDADGNIAANLRYACEMTEKNLFGYSLENYREVESWGDPLTVTKYITADAKTGELLSLSTGYPLWERAADQSSDVDEKTAEAFLQACAPERFAETSLREGSAAEELETQTYARMHDGYFFPENYLEVRVNNAVGTVDEYRFVWDDEAEFAPSEGIVDKDAALGAYVGALDVTLGYTAWPEAISYDDPILYRYIDWGYTYIESLLLAYWLGGTDAVEGVDALTGEALTTPANGSFSYDDLTGVPEKAAIEALGEAGIGFDGGSFRPAEPLTMADAASLLLQANGYDVRGWDEKTLKSEAVWLGLVAPGDWQPEQTMTRMELIRMTVGASEYGASAALKGIWSSGFKDVDEADEGFAAIARALGMASGKKLEPDAICTRADGAQLLYSFMKR